MGLRGPNAHGGKKRKAKRRHPSVLTWRRKGLSRAERVINFLEVLPAARNSTARSRRCRQRQCAADRQRRHRAREHEGRITLPVDVDEAALAVALVDAGFLAINDQDDRRKLATALSRVVKIITADLSILVSRVTADQH